MNVLKHWYENFSNMSQDLCWIDITLSDVYSIEIFVCDYFNLDTGGCSSTNFKITGFTNDVVGKACSFTSNCSTINAPVNNEFYKVILTYFHQVFLTPRKPCGLAKTKIEPDQVVWSFSSCMRNVKLMLSM